MSEQSRAWTGKVSQGALGDAGPYSSEKWSQTWRTLIGTGANKSNRGVQRGVDNELQVFASSPADTNIVVKSGAALVQGRWYYNSADKNVAIAANASGSVRVDVVVLKADYVAQTVRISVHQGTPGAGIPALTQSAGTIWEIPLAYLTLASGFTTIPNSLITDLREYTNIPNALGIDVTNSSGGTLEQGSTVIWHASGGQAINTTTTEGNQSVAGVIEARVANGAVGRIITQGLVSVLCDESVAVGNLLELSTTAGQAHKSLKSGVFARVLTANTGAGTRCLAYVNVPTQIPLIVTGTYSGNNGATQAITGIGFKPRRVEIHSSSSANPGLLSAVKTDQDGTSAVLIGIDGGGSVLAYTTDIIISLDNDGFTVGDCTPIGTNLTNASSRNYYFTCWR